MQIKYFQETDTLLIIFYDNQISEKRDLNENVLAEFDISGNLVSITIEHAGQNINIDDFSLQKVLAS
jgi:uncharacterized protein YuzE